MYIFVWFGVIFVLLIYQACIMYDCSSLLPRRDRNQLNTYNININIVVHNLRPKTGSVAFFCIDRWQCYLRMACKVHGYSKANKSLLIFLCVLFGLRILTLSCVYRVVTLTTLQQQKKRSRSMASSSAMVTKLLTHTSTQTIDE